MLRRKSLYGILVLGIFIVIGSLYFFTDNQPNTSEKNMSVNKEVGSDNNTVGENEDNNSKEVNHENIIKEIINISEEVNADNMYETVTYLAEQPRAAGTEGEKRAVDYIESQFKSLGYETTIQEFPIEYYKEIRKAITINDKPLEGDIRTLFGSNVSGKVKGELVHVGKATVSEVGEEVKGKIALIENSARPYYEKISNVMNKGAIGAIMYNDQPNGSFNGMVKDGNDIPIITISRDQGQKLVDQVEKGTVIASLDVEVEKVTTPSYNVIATMKPDNSNNTGQIVTVGAHHDSVPGGPGANDDASGVSAVLELARIFSQKSIDTELRFITFGAEEKGLIGSTYYVNNLPSEEKSKIIAHFQMDMVGAAAAGGQNPAGGLIMFTPDGRKNLVTDLGAAASKNIFSEAIPYGELGRSDHQPFHDVGIPAALFIHAPLEPDYHQPTDTIDKISKEKLQQVAEIIGSAVLTIASPETPAIAEDKAVPALVEYEYENRAL
ncbi:M28 family peptidase [Cytobacillus sp. FJAT-54145]|uniref:M28 family peptidase n=1 Tax=Cytobacillus spartinae TaxID=3299023 RepID=A0ABW6K6L5_9BACI